ncbi:uncharacterized protein LOC125026623 [Penaeus chinensis]|uniref:uncharacterized protein LOC125026623 n=1 Tax=Penaeus chinensis TaxID=139456 RepID=UPI001FB5EAF6|nr:uncharacterized protein LOC125026623 [Penaeus chinensis]
MASRARWVLLSLLWTFCQSASVIQDGLVQKTCLEQGPSDVPSRNTSLPEIFTVKPNEAEWRFNFTLADDKDERACVSLEVIMEKIQLSLYKTECVGDNIVDFQLWPLNYVRRGQWTLLNVTVKSNVLYLSTPQSESTKLVISTGDLPQGVFQVTNSRGVSFSLGCQVNCPATVGSKNKGEGLLSTIKEMRSPYEHFYLKPGIGFARLNFEIACETLLGYEVTVGETDLSKDELAVLVPLEKWHKIFLEYDKESQNYAVFVDYRQTKVITNGLSHCQEFSRFLVRAEGETFVSFICDPATGEYKAKPPACEASHHETHLVKPISAAVFITIMIVVSLSYAILYLLGYRLQKKGTTPRSNVKKKISEKTCEETVLRTL